MLSANILEKLLKNAGLEVEAHNALKEGRFFAYSRFIHENTKTTFENGLTVTYLTGEQFKLMIIERLRMRKDISDSELLNIISTHSIHNNNDAVDTVKKAFNNVILDYYDSENKILSDIYVFD